MVTAVRDRSIQEIFGWPDDVKLRLCMTLFVRACPVDNRDFCEVLDRYYGGEDDPVTLDRLARLAESD